jgi:copper chaperone CopZ
MLPAWLKIGSAVLLLILIINGYLQKYLNSRKMSSEKPSESNSDLVKTTTIYVGGMTCNHCRENVENSIKSVNGVDNVSVDLATGKVIISGKSFNLSKVKTGVESIGYKIKEDS